MIQEIAPSGWQIDSRGEMNGQSSPWFPLHDGQVPRPIRYILTSSNASGYPFPKPISESRCRPKVSSSRCQNRSSLLSQSRLSFSTVLLVSYYRRHNGRVKGNSPFFDPTEDCPIRAVANASHALARLRSTRHIHAPLLTNWVRSDIVDFLLLLQ